MEKTTKNWYVLYVSPRSEKKVKERLETMGVECYLPLHSSPSVWSDRVKMVDKPLFTSYIFVCCKEPELYPLIYVYGIIRIIYFCDKPAVIRQWEIDAIHDFLEQAMHRSLCVGDEVEILSGAMKRVSGKVQRIKKKYLVLYIEQLGATVAVNLDNVAWTDRIR
ncbi:MAG: UpxY family transcription antiterminator [Tannerella sp.]|jgi:transcription antitermination factor NusG|nr:UpxY family transcription antiterminator [Tannerella sp.]